MLRLRIVCCLLVGLIGCTAGGPPTEHVSGQITFDGKPVVGAQVGFIPSAGQPNVKPAQGMTDEEGQFTLKTYVDGGRQVSGAMVGQFRVTVTEAIAENRIVGYDELATASTLPEKFADANATTLSAAVTADGKNEFDFALEPTDD